MKNGFSFDVTQCGSCQNQSFGGMCRLHLQGVKNPRCVTALAIINRLNHNAKWFCILVTSNFVPNALVLSTLKIEATHSSETSALTRSTLPHIEEDGILHSHGREITSNPTSSGKPQIFLFCNISW
jgi:hypothetical protein